MKGLIFGLVALALLLVAAGEASAHGRTVVRRGVFGRTVVVQRGFSPSVNRGLIVDPHFGSR